MLLKIDNEYVSVGGSLINFLDSDIGPVIPDEPIISPEIIYMNVVKANSIRIELEDGQTLVPVSSEISISGNIIAPISSLGKYNVNVVNSDNIVVKKIVINVTDPRSSYVFNAIHKIEDIFATVQEDEMLVVISRHAARGNDTTVTGDLSSTGITQCKTLGAKLKNNNIDLTKTYIGGSHKYRAKNTAYQITKAMGVPYSSDYNYLNADGYEWLMERDFFTDADGGSSGISLYLNAYYCYVNEDAYTGVYIDNKTEAKEGVEGDHQQHVNKVPNHVNTKAQNIIDNAVSIASSKNVDLAWFGTHDKVICPLTAYITERKNPIHIDRNNTDPYVKVSTSPSDTSQTGTWSIPLIGGIAIIVNKTTGRRETYAFDSGF